MIKAIFLPIFGFIIFLTLLGVWFWFSFPDFSPDRQVTELEFPAVNERVYISSEIWGMTYDRQVVFISARRRTRFDYQPDQDYVYKSGAPIFLFYRTTDDSMIVYTRGLSAVPDNFGSRIGIRQVVVDDYEEIQRLNKNYRPDKGCRLTI